MTLSSQEKNIAIFASGGGSNAEAIINHLKGNPNIWVRLIVTNKATAYVLERAKNHGLSSFVISKDELAQPTQLIEKLNALNIDLIALAGFLLKIPQPLIQAFPNKITNIHPSLLPKYGGAGMYGHRVHQAVFDNNESESGMTIHFVNEVYDEGKIIFQEKTPLDIMDTPDVIAKKVLQLEHKNYGQVIEKLLSTV